MFDLIQFQSEGATLSGRLYHSIGRSPSPCIVMAHGTSATIRMVADDYARTFHEAGMSVLLYDHRNIGDSGGEPRQEINPWVQARGYRDAVDFLRARSDIDGKRIALWGDSYSAGQVLVAGALIDGLAAVVAQTPTCGAELPAIESSRSNFEALKEIFETGDVRGTVETTIGPLPVVSCDQRGTPSLLKPIQAFRWFIEYGGRHNSGWENRVTRVVPRTSVPFSPFLSAPFLTVPTLMIVGRNDEMAHCNPLVQRAAFDRIAASKEFHEIDGGHFGLLAKPSALFDEASDRQAKFLREALSA